MSKNLISVVIPIYNVEKYLNKCVDSVLNQTYKNLEIILIDDESPDNCGTVCDEYKVKYSNIKVIHKKNDGLGMARNSGIDLATGDYVYFLDSDDYIAENEIEKLYYILNRFNLDMIRPGFTYVNTNQRVLFRRRFSTEIFLGDKVRKEMLPRIIGSAPEKKDSIDMGVSGAMYSLEIIKNKNIRFVSERKLKNEDMVFNIDFLKNANGACVFNSIGYYYLNNPESISKKYLHDRFERDKVFHLAMKDKLILDGFDNSVIKRLQRNFFIHILIVITQISNLRNHMNFFEKIKEIKNVCNCEIVKNTISEYPYHKLGIKQKIFIILVKYELAVPLLLLTKINW